MTAYMGKILNVDLTEGRCVESTFFPVPLFTFKMGFDEDAPSGSAFSPETGTARIVIGELERVAVSPETDTGRLVDGYLLVYGTPRPLPVGSTLNPGKGMFSWLPGPGFVGPYRFIFIIEEEDGRRYKKRLDIVIEPGR